jgi:CHAD domain-containing protein
MSEIVKSYYLEHKAIFEENFNLVLQSFNMEAIHKLRTTTKRLRALFQLMEFLSDEKFKAKKQLKKIRTIFKHAGKIRETQIEQEMLANYEIKLKKSFPSYREYLQQREHREIAAFLKSVPKLSDRTTILDHQKILTATDAIPEDIKTRTEYFTNWKIGQLRKLNEKPTSNHRIHKNRTYLKQLYYLYDVICKLTGKENILNMPADQLREIEQMIGNWHDKINSTRYLNNFFESKHGEKTKDYLQLKLQIISERKLLREEITLILRDI